MHHQVVSRPRRGVFAAALFLLSACQSDYQFHTTAVYEAPQGQYSIRVEARGIVKGGHDISEVSSGAFTISPSGPPGPVNPEPLMVEVALRGSLMLLDRLGLPDDATRERIAAAMSQLLSDSGYSVHQDEVEEFLSAVEGVLLGPKGTPMSGQTKALEVVSVAFDR